MYSKHCWRNIIIISFQWFFPSFTTANNIEKKDRERDNLSMHLFSMNMFLYFMKLKEFFFENAFYVVVDITRRYFFALSFSFPSTAWLLFSQTPVEEGSNNKNKVSHITWLRVKDFFFYSRDRAHKYKRRKKYAGMCTENDLIWIFNESDIYPEQ